MTTRTTLAISALSVLLLAGTVAAQTTGQTGSTAVTSQAASPASRPEPTTIPGWARVSFFADGAWDKYSDGTTSSYTELITAVSIQSPIQKAGGLEYHLDARMANYPSSQYYSTRSSLYEGYVGLRWDEDRLGFRVGQLWLNDLGALGQVGGGAFEVRWPVGGAKMRLRFGAFGGFEPQILKIAYASGVHKFGGYAVLESKDSVRRHVIGYVNIRDNGLTERSVVTFQNYVPLFQNKIFIYQAAEYDLVGPAGQGSSHLTYFFANARVKPAKRLELWATYHHGRSIDTRGITQQVLNGQPIDPKAAEGFMFESYGGRVSYEVARGVRLFAGYNRDRDNAGDSARQRYQAGVWASDLFKTGFDVNVTEWINRQDGLTNYNSLFVSVGRNVNSHIYLEGEYNQSVSTLRLLTNNSFTLISRPQTHRYALSSIIRINKPTSVMVNLERMQGQGYSENRVTAGLTWRF